MRTGSGEPLLLLHGVMGSERHWVEVAPLLAGTYDVIAPTALGHLGGPPVGERPVTITQIIDCAERQMDELALDRAHIAGNSMGGSMALELARRGRALSVCALSPAGFWAAGGEPEAMTLRRLKAARRMGRLTRPLLPALLRSRAMRRFGLRDVAVDGGRVPAALALEFTDVMLGCEVADAVFETTDHCPPLDPLPCPITIAWGEHDRIFLAGPSGACAVERFPNARHLVLEGVGHVPMFDDPALTARTIEESAGRG
jgi:pimeloyl-ACP methyl ester carboxylesterase